MSNNKFSGEPFYCERCSDNPKTRQRIFWNENLHVFTNFDDGIGGDKGLRHACHNRQERYKTGPNDKFVNIMECPRCGKKYDGAEFFECPTCFIQCCQNCGKLFHWTVFHRNCPNCHDMRSRMIQRTKFMAELADPNPKTGKYKRIYIPRPDYEIKEEVSLITSCYHRLKAKWEAKGIKMKCIVSNCRSDVVDKSDYCNEHILQKV